MSVKIFKAFIIPVFMLALAGCAEPVRYKINMPPIAESPNPQTIFGEATLTDSPENLDPQNIKIPALPHNNPLSLDECLELAQKVSPSLDSAEQNYVGAIWSRWQAITNYLPTANTQYTITHYDETQKLLAGSAMGRNQYTWGANVSQPLFTGGKLTASYLLSQLGVSQADIQKTQAREDLLLAVKQAYFSILASEKALDVAKTSVENLRSHLNVAQNFFDVGMVPKNQVLEAEVELARAQQEETNQIRNLVVNKARLNILLRQSPDAPIKVTDTLKYHPFPLVMDRCLQISLVDNPEIRLGHNKVEASTKSIDLARSNLYPQMEVIWGHTSTGNSTRAHGGWAANDSSWNMALVSSFNIWDWGRSKADVEKSKVELNRSIDTLTGLEDSTKLEVTTNYQDLISAGKNIDVSRKAITAAAEDLRMVTERYQEQVATSTEVLDAQTRYSEAQYEHYQALYNYNLAWAAIERTMGQRVTPDGLIGEPK